MFIQFYLAYVVPIVNQQHILQYPTATNQFVYLFMIIAMPSIESVNIVLICHRNNVKFRYYY